MAWYIMRTAASMPPRSRDQGSRRWLGPFTTGEEAVVLLGQLVADGHRLADLVIEEDPAVADRAERRDIADAQGH